jgi:hypothetical protein
MRVAAVEPERGSEVERPGAPQHADGQVAQCRHDLRAGAGADLVSRRVFDQGAFLEPCAGADQCDQMGCVERAPPGLCGLDDLVARGWVVEDAGKLALTEDVETADFVTTINVLRRIVANLGGNSDLP